MGEHNLVLSEALKNSANLLEGVSRNPNMLKRFSDQATILQVSHAIFADLCTVKFLSLYMLWNTNLVLSETLKNFSNLLNGVSRNPNMLKRFSDQATILQVRCGIMLGQIRYVFY